MLLEESVTDLRELARLFSFCRRVALTRAVVAFSFLFFFYVDRAVVAFFLFAFSFRLFPAVLPFRYLFELFFLLSLWNYSVDVLLSKFCVM